MHTDRSNWVKTIFREGWHHGSLGGRREGRIMEGDLMALNKARTLQYESDILTIAR
jgi:hypothetical protein